MQILFVEGNTDGTVGGSYYCLLDLIRRLDRGKFTPTVVFYRDHQLLPQFKAIAETVVLPSTRGFLFAEKAPKALRPLVRPFQRMLNLLFVRIPSYFAFRRFAQDRQIALIHLNNGPSEPIWTLVAKQLGIKLVAHLRGIPTLSGSPRWICDRCDQIICVSHAIEKMLRQLYPTVSHTATIYDGIELPSSVPAVARQHSATDAITIGVVANIKRWKGQDTAIRALAELKNSYPSLKLLLIGGTAEIVDDRNFAHELKSLVSSLGLTENVVFTGFRSDAWELIQSLDLLILPSQAPEPFGRVILEAMCANVPVIATGHGGPTEIITDGKSGLLFPPGDSHALAAAIDRLLANSGLRG